MEGVPYAAEERQDKRSSDEQSDSQFVSQVDCGKGERSRQREGQERAKTEVRQGLISIPLFYRMAYLASSK
jgi:hypothetical protein